MPDIYKSRWDFITKTFNKIKPFVENPSYKVEIENCDIKHIEVNDKEIFSYLDEERKCRGIWAENDKKFDHGLYRSIPEWKEWFKDNVKVYSIINVNWM